MDFLTLAKNRYSVRKFKDKPIEKEKLDAILKAGSLAPTGCNKQPQRILVIESEEARRKLQKCTTCHFNAPVILLICADTQNCWTRPFDGKNIAEIDATIVTTHLMLEAAEQGLGSTWVAYFDPAKVVEEFNVPDKLVPVALLPIGYAADDAAPAAQHNSRVPLSEIVRYNSF